MGTCSVYVGGGCVASILRPFAGPLRASEGVSSATLLVGHVKRLERLK